MPCVWGWSVSEPTLDQFIAELEEIKAMISICKSSEGQNYYRTQAGRRLDAILGYLKRLKERGEG